MNKQIQANLALLLIALIWGSTFVMVKEAVKDFSVFSFLALRFSLALASLMPFCWQRFLALQRKPALAGLLTGLFFFAGYAFQTLGLRQTSAAKAGFITGLYVVIVPLLSTLVLRQRPSGSALAGVALATVGLTLLSLRGDFTAAQGDLLVLMCAFAFAAHIVAVGKFTAEIDTLTLTALQIAAVVAASAVVCLITERPSFDIPTGVLGIATFTGVVATALVLFLQTWAQRLTTPTHTALIFSTEPVFAALFGYLLANEHLGARALAGCGLILAGMVIAEAQGTLAGAKKQKEGPGVT
ncbi:MAG: DMT family transporter [Chloroflexi bacterium]|nr:DMT family transporter [Chloroflexota bacterium]